MIAEYVINDTFDDRENRPVGKIYHGAEIYLIEKFIEAKRKYIAALLEFNEKYPKYMNSGYEIEKINNLINEKSKTLKELDQTFNRIFKKSKLCNLKAELIKLREEKELENSSISNLKSHLIELESEIINQHEICLKYYCQLDELINWFTVSDFKYLFKKYNIFMEKSDNNYFNEEMEMRAVLRDYLYMDSYLIVDQIPTKRLVK